ncbi:MAG: glycosyltransferase family 2 protein, partial [Elusimicrobiota bacterium]
HDGSGAMVLEKFPSVRLIQNSENRYFARANNQALRQAQGRYLLILNPDTYLTDNAFRVLIEFMDAHPRAGACGPKILNPDGTYQGSGDRVATAAYALCEAGLINALFPRNPVKTARIRLGWNRDTTEQVDSISGACMMVRKKTVDQAGLMDERFLLYWEETDWCRSIKQAGWEVYFVHSSQIHHHQGKATNKVNKEKIEKIFYESMCQYYTKWQGPIFGLALRACLKFFTFPALKAIKTIKDFR